MEELEEQRRNMSSAEVEAMFGMYASIHNVPNPRTQPTHNVPIPRTQSLQQTNQPASARSPPAAAAAASPASSAAAAAPASRGAIGTTWIRRGEGMFGTEVSSEGPAVWVDEGTEAVWVDEGAVGSESGGESENSGTPEEQERGMEGEEVDSDLEEAIR